MTLEVLGFRRVLTLLVVSSSSTSSSSKTSLCGSASAHCGCVCHDGTGYAEVFQRNVLASGVVPQVCGVSESVMQ